MTSARKRNLTLTEGIELHKTFGENMTEVSEGLWEYKDDWSDKRIADEFARPVSPDQIARARESFGFKLKPVSRRTGKATIDDVQKAVDEAMKQVQAKVDAQLKHWDERFLALGMGTLEVADVHNRLLTTLKQGHTISQAAVEQLRAKVEIK